MLCLVYTNVVENLNILFIHLFQRCFYPLYSASFLLLHSVSLKVSRCVKQF